MAARLVVRVGLLLLFVTAGLVGRADDKVRKDFDPEKIRKELARARADFERRRDPREKAASDRRAAEFWRDAQQKTRAWADEQARTRAAQTLAYKFVPGQTFGYSVEIEVESFDKTERFSGTPVFSVKSVEKNGEALLFAVGKLAYTSIKRGTVEEKKRPGRDVWLGSVIKMGPSGDPRGKKDHNETSLPDFLLTLVKPKELIFTDLTASITGSRREEKSATLWLHGNPKGLLDMGIKTIKGTETRVLLSTPLTGPIVQVQKERTFRSEEGPSLTLRYASTSRFDHDRGLLLDTSATCTSESDSGSKPIAIKISNRLLEGEALQRAVDQANIDWADRPSELEPFELRRILLDVKSPPRLRSPREATPGLVVAHFNDGELRWYLAEVIAVVSERNSEVKVRYQGSEEVLVVPAGQLAIPPADMIPKSH